MFSTPETSVHVLDKNRKISDYLTNKLVSKNLVLDTYQSIKLWNSRTSLMKKMNFNIQSSVPDHCRQKGASYFLPRAALLLRVPSRLLCQTSVCSSCSRPLYPYGSPSVELISDHSVTHTHTHTFFVSQITTSFNKFSKFPSIHPSIHVFIIKMST